MREGFPTFFAILSVNYKVDETRLAQARAFQRKMNAFPEDVIEEAYKTLKNQKLRANYIRFLKAFQEVYLDLEDNLRDEIKQEHRKWVKKEKEAILMNFIFEHHPNWDILYDLGH